jgi:hypothetical protein
VHYFFKNKKDSFALSRSMMAVLYKVLCRLFVHFSKLVNFADNEVKYSLMKKLITVLSLVKIAVFPLFAQSEVDTAALVGIWKLEEAGFYVAGEKEVKPFDACRLSRNFIFEQGGKARYHYYEGSVDDCYIGQPEEYSWTIKDSVLTLMSSQSTQQQIIRWLADDVLLLETYLKERIEVPGDKLTEEILNTIHYDRYRRIDRPVYFEGSKPIE